eukprot:gene62492-85467_t
MERIAGQCLGEAYRLVDVGATGVDRLQRALHHEPQQGDRAEEGRHTMRP